MNNFKLNPIGIIHSPYKEKFAVPRQPNLISKANGELHLLSPFDDANSVKGLKQFSHLWLLFIFHHINATKWNLTVRPPRLGGNKKLGVFATRSPFRPNHIGLSAVELHDVVIDKNKIILKLGSLDLVDGTPIIDIKPYLPYCDSYPNAKAGYAQLAPTNQLTVQFSTQAKLILLNNQLKYPDLAELISQVLSQDPRPAYKQNSSAAQIYGIKLYHFNIKWQVINQQVMVLDIQE